VAHDVVVSADRLAEVLEALADQPQLLAGLLKRAVADLLPPVILERPKSGMLAPVEAWFQGPLRGMARERLLDGLAGYGLVERDYLERLLGGRLGGMRPRRGAKIWLLVTLEAWLRTVFRRGAAPFAVDPPPGGTAPSTPPRR